MGDLLRPRGEGERCDQDCLICNGENGKNCRKRGVVYQIWCRTCDTNGVKSIYIGESGNCGHQRACDHVREYESENEETKVKSVMRKHVDSVHGGDKTGIEFDMKITDIFKNDPLGRQIMEGIRIRLLKCHHSLNSKDEFRQP